MDSLIKLHYFIAFAGIWAIGNGVLHTVFVLRESRPYDRELIRLLIDGHLLMFSGVIYALCYNGIRNLEPLALHISTATALFLLGYCALIFKILPSLVTIVINAIALIWLVGASAL